MKFDTDNKVVKLCAEGMALESEGKIKEAQEKFTGAWNIASSDFEAFTAAHYLARNQPTHELKLEWNLVALERAKLVPDEGIKGHMPSLFLNIGKSYENLGRMKDATAYYQEAAAHSHFLPPGAYGDMIRSGISEGLKRSGSEGFNPPVLTCMVNSWCERKELKPLSFVLPAYLGNLGTAGDKAALSSALAYLSATRCLNSDDQKKTDQLIQYLGIDNV